MKKIKVFIDSDVVISSLVSSKGAAYLLIQTKGLERYVSDISIKELFLVTERLQLNKKILNNLIKNKFKKIILLDLKEIKKTYKQYVVDENDAHVVAGAVQAGASHIISYNLKHFKKEEIKRCLNILIFTPALFLQYWRSNC